MTRGLGILALCAGLAWVSVRYHYAADWTAASRHTLSHASIAVLQNLTNPVTATAYVPDHPEIRERVTDLFSRYQRHKPDLTLHFIDPRDIPDVARAQGLHDGEIVLTVGNKTEVVREYSEQSVTNAFARLLRSRERWIVFVTGHGERDPIRGANHDISDWAQTLKNRGLKTSTLDLAGTKVIPDNTSVVVIASPRIAYLPGELALVTDYVENGGNLLWFSEPDEPPELKALAAAIGVERIPGTVVDPLTQALGIDNPAMAVVTAYGTHASVADFDVLCIFPYAAAIYDRPQAGWTATRLFSSSAKAWGETSPLSGNVAFDEGQDYPGPLPLAIALSRTLRGADKEVHEQRMIVVGDGDFVTNTYVGNSGNRDLGVRLIEWLATEDALINVPAHAAADTDLLLSKWEGVVIVFGFLVLLPLAFAANGFLIWWRRRRA